MFKSAHEREADRREREEKRVQAQAEAAERERRAQEERERAAYLATPVGAATAAKDAGDTFFEIQLKVGAHYGSAGFGSTDSRHTTTSSAATLAQIEALGWRLEHANYFFMITGETSTDRFLASGEATAINGVTMGAYLFRNGAAASH